ncbi:unnamed protein product [Rotaria sordida]|uniref:Uncharacterized protein n=1 Tax=Rotaria sordida TaxID=392033 RepID=A0A813PS66_9BILA|nr:unnamed protein product [Rotaria sordida]
MTNGISLDLYFDDEDKENEEIYRQLLRKCEVLPPCDPTTLPFFFTFSITTADVQSDNFIVPKTFSSFLEYYLTNPIKFQDDSDTKYSIILQLYSNC